MRKQTIVCFSEIFNFAKEKHEIEWNPCCDMFHRGAILCNDDGKNTEFDLEELQMNLEEDKNNPYYSEQKRLGYKIVEEFMIENNLTEMYVTNE